MKTGSSRRPTRSRKSSRTSSRVAATGTTRTASRASGMVDEPFLEVTRAAYDTVAADYAELLRDELSVKPWDRAVLATFAELGRAGGAGAVADLGCGPGRITVHLHDLGLDAFGIDLSPGLIGVARAAHPGLRFDEGTMTDLSIESASLAGAV